jgi:hypothetical protein
MRPGILFLDQPAINSSVQLVQLKCFQIILDMKEKAPTANNFYFNSERLWLVEERARRSMQVGSRKYSCLGFTTVAVTLLIANVYNDHSGDKPDFSSMLMFPCSDQMRAGCNSDPPYKDQGQG